MKRLLAGLLLGSCAAIVGTAVLASARKSRLPDKAEPDPRPNASPGFSIRRSKCEVGFVYWILEGYGRCKCFILCDSWQEAMDEANARLAGMAGIMSSAVAASF